VLVYVGAIAVLIVFVILLTRGADSAPLSPAARPIAGIVVATAIFGVLAWAIVHSGAIHSPQQPAPSATVRQLGVVLMQDYVFPLEVIGLMLTVALIGAVIVAMKDNAQ
jgi:NADH:ubiquinone oxidoreductase subunit 6 (subunit J)